MALLPFLFLPHVQGAPQPYLEMHRSAPVEINGLEFVAATQAQWVVAASGKQESIEVQLFITNHTREDLAFRLFDTFELILKNNDGTDVRSTGVRDGTNLSPPVLIRAGDTYCLNRQTQLNWKLEGKLCEFFYWDGTGTCTHYRPLAAGSHSLVFRFKSTQQDAAGEGKNLKGMLIWSGEGQTQNASFEIVER